MVTSTHSFTLPSYTTLEEYPDTEIDEPQSPLPPPYSPSPSELTIPEECRTNSSENISEVAFLTVLQADYNENKKARTIAYNIFLHERYKNFLMERFSSESKNSFLQKLQNCNIFSPKESLKEIIQYCYETYLLNSIFTVAFTSLCNTHWEQFSALGKKQNIEKKVRKAYRLIRFNSKNLTLIHHSLQELHTIKSLLFYFDHSEKFITLAKLGNKKNAESLLCSCSKIKEKLSSKINFHYLKPTTLKDFLDTTSKGLAARFIELRRPDKPISTDPFIKIPEKFSPYSSSIYYVVFNLIGSRLKIYNENEGVFMKRLEEHLTDFDIDRFVGKVFHKFYDALSEENKESFFKSMQGYHNNKEASKSYCLSMFTKHLTGLQNMEEIKRFYAE